MKFYITMIFNAALMLMATVGCDKKSDANPAKERKDSIDTNLIIDMAKSLSKKRDVCLDEILLHNANVIKFNQKFDNVLNSIQHYSTDPCWISEGTLYGRYILYIKFNLKISDSGQCTQDGNVLFGLNEINSIDISNGIVAIKFTEFQIQDDDKAWLRLVESGMNFSAIGVNLIPKRK